MKRTIELYGPLRSMNGGDAVELDLPSGAGPYAVRLALEAWSRARGVSFARILERSVVAVAEEVLADADAIGDASVLAVLPPVCGG